MVVYPLFSEWNVLRVHYPMNRWRPSRASSRHLFWASSALRPTQSCFAFEPLCLPRINQTSPGQTNPPHPAPTNRVLYLWLQSSCGPGGSLNMKYSCCSLVPQNTHIHTNVHQSKISESSYSVHHYYLHPDRQRARISNSVGALLDCSFFCLVEFFCCSLHQP